MIKPAGLPLYINTSQTRNVQIINPLLHVLTVMFLAS